MLREASPVHINRIRMTEMWYFSNISLAIENYLREADVQKWARCQFPGYKYEISKTNPAESINSTLVQRESIQSFICWTMSTQLFYKCKKLISKHKHPLTKDVEKKIDRRTQKGKTFSVYPINDGRLLVRGDKIDCLVDLGRQTCSCGKYDLMKIPCMHAIKAGFHFRKEPHTLTDLVYTTWSWKEAY